LESDQNTSQEAASALESFLYDLNAESVSLEAEPLQGSASFGSETTSEEFLGKKDAIASKLKELGLSTSLKEQTGFLSGNIGLSSLDSGHVGTELKKLVEANATELEILQPGQLEIEELPDSDSNASYPVPLGEIPAMLNPGHSLEEPVKVEVKYYLVRGIFDSAMATEK